MRVLVIAVKGIKELFRDRKALLFTLLFPLFLILFFRAASGIEDVEDTTYSIAVVDLDTGEGLWDDTEPPWMEHVNNASGTHMTATEFFRESILGGRGTGGEYLVEDVLKSAEYPSGVKRFSVSLHDDEARAREAVADGDAVAYVIIPVNYSQALQGVVDWAVVDELRAHGESLGYRPPDYGIATVALSGELTSFDYSFAASQVNAVLQTYTETLYWTVRGNIGAQFPEGPVSEEAGSTGVVFSSLDVSKELNLFDLTVPGIIIFGLMMQAMGVTATLGQERKDRTLDRLRMTKMTSFDLLGGITIRWMVMGVFQVIILFGVALLLGMNVAGDVPLTIAGAMLIALVVVLATISLGLIVSAFVDDPEQATQLSVVVIMPMAFFTGAFFPVDVAAAEVLPWTQGALAMKQMMHYADWGSAAYHTAICLVMALVLFAVGVLAYSRNRLRSN
jgi:ABC-2 type transport system permease protein